MACRSPCKVSKVPWSTRKLSDQTFLHVKHAHHPSDSPRVQFVLCLPTFVQPCSYQCIGPSSWTVARCRRNDGTEDSCGRNCILHFSSYFVCGNCLRSLPCCILSDFYL